MSRVGRARARSRRGDEGSVLLLGIGLVAVCALAVVALVDVSAAFLHRQHLLAVADAAALAGAQAIDLPAYYESGATQATRLSAPAVTAAVRSHLARSGALAAVEGMAVERIWTDGRQVVVALRAPLSLPFMSDVFGGPVRVESWAQMDYREAP